MYCGCGYFIKYKELAYKHRKKCCVTVLKTKKDITAELVFDMANLQLDKIKMKFKCDWVARFGSLNNCPIK